jgi:acetyltransferase
MRYMSPLLYSDRVAHERLARICHCDYDREITLVAENPHPQAEDCRMLGVSRMSKIHGSNEARFSVLVSDLCFRA